MDVADEVQNPRAPGWKHDPTGRFAGRYWDGRGWTQHVVGQDRVTTIDRVPVRPAQPDRPTTTDQPVARPGADVPLWAKLALVAAVVGVLFLVVRPDEGNDPPAATATSPTAAAVTSAPSAHTLGQAVSTGGFDITVHGFKDPEAPGDFLRPMPGRHFVSVDVEVANRSSRQRSFSFLLGFHLLDAADNQLDPTFGDLMPPPPDGDIAPGRSLRGWVVFEVPDGTSGLRLRARGDLVEAGGLFPLR